MRSCWPRTCFAYGRGAVQAAAIRGDTLEPADAELLDALVGRRVTREPLQHLTGTAPFRHLELRVGPGVFVPRPETEMVAQLAIDALAAAASPAPIAVDLGTGSGAIALALATEVPHARVFAAENSVDAYVWTQGELRAGRGGQRRTGVHRPRAGVPGARRAGLGRGVEPAVRAGCRDPARPEVRFFDPPAALYGGEDGLDVVRVVSRTGLRLAHPGGIIVIEHGEWQGEAMRSLLAADGWRAAATHPDLTLRDRATTAIAP